MPTTANNETLERIKNELAKDINELMTWGQLELAIRERLWPEVAKRYARECVKASLKEAAQNAMVTRNYDYSLETPEYLGTIVNKSSITNEKNIKLL